MRAAETQEGWRERESVSANERRVRQLTTNVDLLLCVRARNMLGAASGAV